MRAGRWIVGVGVALLVAVSFAAADAGEKTKLKGSLDGGGRATISYSYELREGTRNLSVEWTLRPIHVRCEGDGQPRIAAMPVAGGSSGPATRGKSFGVVAFQGDFDHPKYKARVSGELRSRHEARGFVRVRGSRVPLKGGGHADCDSGRLHFTATR